jgi:hypothetical protein
MRDVTVFNDVWHVGDARCGDTLITIVFARHLFAHADLDRLAYALRSIHPADRGVVVTTSIHAARQIGLPYDYRLLLLPEVVLAQRTGFALDFERFGRWLQRLEPTTAKRAPTRVGRPTPGARIGRIFEARHNSRMTCDTVAGEAKAILADWKQHFPDQKKPGYSTTREHVGRLMSPGGPRIARKSAACFQQTALSRVQMRGRTARNTDGQAHAETRTNCGRRRAAVDRDHPRGCEAERPVSLGTVSPTERRTSPGSEKWR